MSKNAEGWIRHRGGKCPVDDDAIVEVRLRDGTLWINGGAERGSHWTWEHSRNFSDIMAYRLHKPAEQVEACSKPDPCDSAKRDSDYVCWMRDRITEIDATTSALTTERAELVQKLASEGFALIGRINGMLTEAAQKHEDVGDPKNWKVGDELIAIGNCGGFSFAGEVVKILVVRDDGGFEVATESEPDYGWFFTEEESITDLKFHSRPSA